MKSSLDLASTLTALVDLLFERSNFELKTDVGLWFQVGIDGENYGYALDGSTYHPEWERKYYRSVNIIVVYPHRVYVAVHDRVCFGVQDLAKLEWLNTSNHDSCWRSDGLYVLNAEVLAAFHECIRGIPEGVQSPSAVSVDCSFTPVLQPIYTWVKIQRSKEDRHDTLTSIKKLTPRLSFAEDEKDVHLEPRQHRMTINRDTSWGMEND